MYTAVDEESNVQVKHEQIRRLEGKNKEKSVLFNWMFLLIGLFLIRFFVVVLIGSWG